MEKSENNFFLTTKLSVNYWPIQGRDLILILLKTCHYYSLSSLKAAKLHLTYACLLTNSPGAFYKVLRPLFCQLQNFFKYSFNYN